MRSGLELVEKCVPQGCIMPCWLTSATRGYDFSGYRPYRQFLKRGGVGACAWVGMGIEGFVGVFSFGL
jgi:hypothetical protein